VKDLPASVRQRLENAARAANRPYQEVLQYFGMERFLYRLSQSKHSSQFVLKGALVFTAWGGPASRPTKDIDLLARMANDVESVVAVIRAICRQTVEPDGLEFDAASVTGAAIKEDADYSGVRVTFLAALQRSRISMQIDLGFGDVVTPSATMTTYPTLLDFAAPRLLAYPRETVVAEKFEAMTKLGLLNSRMKDFYDLWILAQRFDFNGPTLASAIRKTFANRHTNVLSLPTALTAEFATDATKKSQWQGFLRKAKIGKELPDLPTIIDDLGSFLGPVAAAVEKKEKFDQKWISPGPWGD
jgi:hypothetical protein